MAEKAVDREFILLTVLAEGVRQFAIPEVRAFQWRKISNILSRPLTESGTGFIIDNKSFIVAENAILIDLLRNLTNINEEFVEGITQLGMVATGTNQGEGVDLVASTYFAEVHTAIESSAEAVDFNASAIVGKVIVLINNTLVVLKVYPKSGERMNNALVNVQYNQAAKSRVAYYCKTAGNWIICTNKF